MANVKNTGDSKAQEAKVEKEVVAQSTSEPVIKERPKKKEIDMDSLVEVYNGTNGILVVEDKKTGETWTFTRYGDTDFISVGQLRSIKNSHSKILTSPWLMINDPEVVDFLGLTKLYENVIHPESLSGIFELNDLEFVEKIRKLPVGCKELVINKAIELADAEDDRMTIRKARAIKEAFGVAVFKELMAD